MARRRRADRRLDPLAVAKLVDELFPTPDWTYEQWCAKREEAFELRQCRSDLAAEYGYTLLDLLRARVESRINTDAAPRRRR